MSRRDKHRLRMTPALIDAIVTEIGQYAAGKRETLLSWAALETFAGFSTVSLWHKDRIKAAFKEAKLRQPRSAKPAKIQKTVDERIMQLRTVVEEQRKIIARYDETWALYEANVHRLGLDPAELRRPLDPSNRVNVRARRGRNSDRS